MESEQTKTPKSGSKRPASDTDFDIDDYVRTDSYEDEPTAAPQIIGRQRSRFQPAESLLPWTSGFNALQPVTAREPFNIFKAMLRHQNLFFQFVLRLPPDTMMDLYAIDKEFHYRLNNYGMSIIYDHALYHAPVAASIFSPTLYPDLLISDPVLKPMDNRVHLARDIPSFRWVKMVLYRQRIVREILTQLALEGLRVPLETEAVLCKFWVVMELRTQALREAFLRDRRIWSDDDIHIFQLFLAKLDMRFSHPVQGLGCGELSHMLLTQKSLTALRNVLVGRWHPEREVGRFDYEDIQQMAIRTYVTEELDTDTHPWIDDEAENGIEPWYWGLLSKENYEFGGSSMDSCLDLVVFEGVRRKLHVQRWYLDFTLYGYVDHESGNNIPGPRKWRGETEVKMPEEGPVDKARRSKVIAEFERSIAVSDGEKDIPVSAMFHERATGEMDTS